VAALIGLGSGAVASPLGNESVVAGQVDRILVVKSERRLYLLQGEQVVAEYGIALGRNPVGHKVFEGDGRTPEGFYYISDRNHRSRFYRSLRISYPNPQDRSLAAEYGIPAGGAIMIHGQPNDPRKAAADPEKVDWTEGCIAVSNWVMDQLWEYVDTGTPIEIRP
jgi:murein L,D-transpeptidase YafK